MANVPEIARSGKARMAGVPGAIVSLDESNGREVEDTEHFPEWAQRQRPLRRRVGP